mmetsp:Transcript_2863/g.8021  ORF Transcript_2863/g.8021 Transcript_2863/m.8021 type:complete len:252 (-) Transcript_2863:2687-3442(-)
MLSSDMELASLSSLLTSGSFGGFCSSRAWSSADWSFSRAASSSFLAADSCFSMASMSFSTSSMRMNISAFRCLLLSMGFGGSGLAEGAVGVADTGAAARGSSTSMGLVTIGGKEAGRPKGCLLLGVSRELKDCDLLGAAQAEASGGAALLSDILRAAAGAGGWCPAVLSVTPRDSRVGDWGALEPGTAGVVGASLESGPSPATCWPKGAARVGAATGSGFSGLAGLMGFGVKAATGKPGDVGRAADAKAGR